MDAQYTGNVIARLRRELGLTQKDLAQRLHVTDKAVSKWERGVNFPDLGLMESLAEALGTTPACLLGLEAASRDETLSALAELSREQLEEARQDLRLFSWGSLAAAVLLGLAYHLTQKRAVEVYYLLHGMITVLGILGLVYLRKYEQIKKWDVPELCSFLGASISLLVYFGYQFITGYTPPDSLAVITVSLAASCTQLHFIQTMQPKIIRLLPLIGTILFTLWQLFLGGVTGMVLLVLLCCLAVVVIHWRKHPEQWRISWKSLGIGSCLLLAVVMALCFLYYPSLVRTYVTANQQKLEDYAQALLETGGQGTCGLWEATAYPELGIVEFRTGGSGLAPGSVYEGFYYSVSGEHVPFPGFAGPDENLGEDALFADPAADSDNFQTSAQLAPGWFWFTLHY